MLVLVGLHETAVLDIWVWFIFRGPDTLGVILLLVIAWLLPVPVPVAVSLLLFAWLLPAIVPVPVVVFACSLALTSFM